MASIDSLKASDGTGAASVATVQSVRAPAATTLIVDTVQGINGKFHATMGTPHTFVDPVTSETITVISEATAVDFQGHVDGGNLEIDTIAPGFTDAGSAVNDIVIIKPTTQWADEVAEVLEVTHNDDGTLKANTVDTTQLVDDAVTPEKTTRYFKTGTISSATLGSTGNKTITGVGFKPKVVRFYGASNTQKFCGAMFENGSMFAAGIRYTTTQAGYAGTDTVLTGFTSGGTLNQTATFVSMNDDGFTINVTNANFPMDTIYVAEA